jgi:carboxypeptidase family protein/TonB-dependent receptor-like protein
MPVMRSRRPLAAVALFWVLLAGREGAGQEMSGSLIGTLRDPQGAAVPGATVRVSSSSLIGGPALAITDARGQFRFPALAPGRYTLDVEIPGFERFHEEGIPISVGSTVAKAIALGLAGVAESLVVEGAGLDARDPGFRTRYGPEDLAAIPTRRAGMFDLIKSSPGVSATSPSSGSNATISVFGSGTNENHFQINGNNTTCPCNGVARIEPGVNFIQDVLVQSIGASAEFGNFQGGMINVITKQGGNRFLYDGSYHSQWAALTARPVRLQSVADPAIVSGYERAGYRDVATSLGGPVARDKAWFFAGYHFLQDADSQPGSDPADPREIEQHRLFARVTWRQGSRWQFDHSLHQEISSVPERPTQVTPAEALARPSLRAPAATLAHVSHTLSASTQWEARLSLFDFSREEEPSTGDRTIPSRFDRNTRVTRGAPAVLSGLNISRISAKAALNHYRADYLGADHLVKVGIQLERGEHHSSAVIPAGVRYVDIGDTVFQAVTSPPAALGGLAETVSAFATDAVSVGERVTIDAGVRFDHSRAASQRLHALDADGRETSGYIDGRGTLFTWNVWSPRLGATLKLTGDGRTMLRSSYGRYSQGVLTGEVSPFHPGATPITTTTFDPITGAGRAMTVDPSINLVLPDRDTKTPRTDEYSIGVDRALGSRVTVSAAYVHKDGRHYLGWTDVAGRYHAEPAALPDGRSITVYQLDSAPRDRRFLLGNPDEYLLDYDGVVLTLDKRQSRGWQAFASYTLSNASGMLPSSGGTPGAAQVSTISPPNPSVFGRDPNDLTNAAGPLPNDRPHMLRAMGAFAIPRTGLSVAANLQYLSGKPWAATTDITLPQGDRRIFLEPRGSRRLPAQTLLDLRVSKAFVLNGASRIELLADVLNALNDSAVEDLATDNWFSPNFSLPAILVDPRRFMLGVRLSLGR